MQLNVVLLPDPLGPMSPRISPSSTPNETSFTAFSAPKRLLRARTSSSGTVASACVSVSRRERHHRIGGLDRRGPHDFGLALDELHHDGQRALVLSRHLRAGREKLYAVALDRAAERNIRVERGL